MKKDEIFPKSRLSELSCEAHSAARIYRFADVEIDAARCCLRRNGEECHLRAQTFRVFIYLIEERGRVVSKDELIRQVWQETAVGDDSLTQCIKEIRKTLDDNAHHPRFIKTIPKIGYRFIASINETTSNNECSTISDENKDEAFVKTDANGAATQAASAIPQSMNAALRVIKTAPHAPRCNLFFVFATSVAVAATLAFAIYFRRETPARRASAETISIPEIAGKKTLAVMRFENQSGNRELEWLREGLADMLAHDLSRAKSLRVLSGEQVETLLSRGVKDGAALDRALDAARRGKAEIFMLGAFARLGERIQISAQLYDARTGQLVAAEQVVAERSDDVFAQVDLLALRLAAPLGVAPAERDAKKSVADSLTNNLDAYRYYSLALEKAQSYHATEAIELWKKAIAIDPQFAMAYARIGYAYTRVLVNQGERGKPYLEKAYQLRERLTEKDKLYLSAWRSFANYDMAGGVEFLREITRQYPRETEAYWLLGRTLVETGELEEASEVYRRALSVDPEAKDVYNALGFALSGIGRSAEAVAAHERYVALAPSEPNAHDSLGMSLNEAGRYAEAIDEFNRALALNPEFHFAHLHLGDVYFRTGRYSDALREYENNLRFAPSDWDRATSYSRMARVFWKRGEMRQAQDAARNEIKYRSDFGTSFLLALAHNDAGAAESLKTALFENSVYAKPKTYATEKWLLYFKGYEALKSGRADEAVANFREVVRRRPVIWNIDGVEDCLADAYLELGRLDEAIGEYERILNLNPNYPPARFHLAQILERKGDITRARSEYEKFLQLWQSADEDLPEMQTAKAKLNL